MVGFSHRSERIFCDVNSKLITRETWLFNIIHPWTNMLLLLLLSRVWLCDPRDGSPPDSPVPGILQARTLEWVAISFSNEWQWKVKVKLLSHVRLLATPWTAAHQAPPSMGFSRQEYWSGVPSPSLVNYKSSYARIFKETISSWEILIQSSANDAS